MPVLTSPLARGVGAAHPQVVALEAQMRLRTSPGTPLPLMFKLHPSGALRGYESGERSPFCLGLCVSCSRSASLFKLHSRVARDARGDWAPGQKALDVLSSRQLDMKEQVRSSFRMLLIPNGSLRSHSSHMEFIKECKKYFLGEYTISLRDKPAFSTSGTRRNTDHNDGDPPDVHRKLPSSAGEDRAMLLGFAMMGFSVLMFFVLGITILKPFLLRHIFTRTSQWADLELMRQEEMCFYTPKCHQHRNDLLSGALDIKEFFDHKNGTPFSCFYSPDSPSEDVILIKSTTRR
ncbi:Calcium-activated potassium channel subunit beta-3 [Bos mutus]|uniref:Calcium-activated potassium channel subunit beta n=1 Tax=Bos mutus TaxID=72004 RepID=M0QSW5_9CETA|nr:Calcium-activated potassium channel subunit beta-3 [Bos mutus]